MRILQSSVFRALCAIIIVVFIYGFLTKFFVFRIYFFPKLCGIDLCYLCYFLFLILPLKV